MEPQKIFVKSDKSDPQTPPPKNRCIKLCFGCYKKNYVMPIEPTQLIQSPRPLYRVQPINIEPKKSPQTIIQNQPPPVYGTRALLQSKRKYNNRNK